MFSLNISSIDMDNVDLLNKTSSGRFYQYLLLSFYLTYTIVKLGTELKYRTYPLDTIRQKERFNILGRSSLNIIPIDH